MNKDATVSIIIPNYNHASFLKQRIGSVLNQSFQDFELIILDDFSTDNSRDIIESYRQYPNISHIVYNTENSGSTFKQWNKGIKLAKGEFVWIAESDDYADPDFLTCCIKEFLANNNLGIVYTDSYEVDKENNMLGRWSRWQQNVTPNIWTESFTRNGQQINADYNQLLNIIPNASCVVFKKDLYLQPDNMNLIEQLRFTGDWLTWFSILQKADVRYCHKPLNYFRSHINTTRQSPAWRLQNVKEQYETLYRLKTTAKTTSTVKTNTLKGLFDLWNPAMKRWLGKENRIIYRMAIRVDPKLPLRFVGRILKKLHLA